MFFSLSKTSIVYQLLSLNKAFNSIPHFFFFSLSLCHFFLCFCSHLSHRERNWNFVSFRNILIRLDLGLELNNGFVKVKIQKRIFSLKVSSFLSFCCCCWRVQLIWLGVYKVSLYLLIGVKAKVFSLISEIGL